MSFNSLNLKENILNSLNKYNFTTPTEIQSRAIPAFLDNKNVFGKSSTGTGKTASFVLPVLQKINESLRTPQVLIMAPTRELALQIVDQVWKFTFAMRNVSAAAVIGGARMDDQIRKIKRSQIIVGTPGRLKDHLDRGTLKLDNINMIILDEADEMLKMGFKNEIDAIFSKAKEDVQIGLYSATVSPRVLDIAKTYMNDYDFIEVADQLKINKNIENSFVFTRGYDKHEVLLKLFEENKRKKTIIFTNTKNNTQKISDILRDNDLRVDNINGDKKQSLRTKIIRKFKNNEVDVLVATDVISRGIDIENVEFVVNFDVPDEDEYFIHRIGRTGRNNKKGSSMTFVSNRNFLAKLQSISKNYDLTINEVDAKSYGLEQKASSGRGFDRNDSRGPRNRDSRSSSLSYGDDRNRRSFGDRKPSDRSFGDRSFGDRKPSDRSFGGSWDSKPSRNTDGRRGGGRRGGGDFGSKKSNSNRTYAKSNKFQ